MGFLRERLERIQALAVVHPVIKATTELVTGAQPV
jgi:EamA domain-containing membrane protein RarD